MKIRNIEKKHRRLRAAVIREITRAVERGGEQELFGAERQLILPARIVIDSAIEEHLRHISALVLSGLPVNRQ